MKTKKFLIAILISGIIFMLFITPCFAAYTPVTEEKLKKALEDLASLEGDKINQIEVSNNNIIITYNNNETSTLKYDLSNNKPTFSYEMSVEKTMTYDEFDKQDYYLETPWFGWMVVANIQGADWEDVTAYYKHRNYLQKLDDYQSTGRYKIINDTNTSGQVTNEMTDSNVIYSSQFGERVMEYINGVYPEDWSWSDSIGINSVEFGYKRKDITETSCKLISTLSVNLEADFSKLEGFAQKTGEYFLDNSITKENADLVLNLKEGQEFYVESSEKITDRVFTGNKACIMRFILRDESLSKTLPVGTMNGYLYAGELKKSIYITVEENTENSNLEPITLKIDWLPVNNPSDTNQEGEKEEIKGDVNQEKNNAVQKHDENSSSEIPYTGKNNLMLFIIMAMAVVILNISIGIRKYNQEK